MAVSVTNIKYGPSSYVYENGGGLTFSWDTVFDGAPPATFDWKVDLLKSDGNVFASSGTQTQATSGATTSMTYNMPRSAMPGAPPPTGVRPQFTITSTAGNTVLQFCIGVTPVPATPPRGPFWPATPGTYGPPAEPPAFPEGSCSKSNSGTSL